ncbi:hypothetical protein [Achromobacter aloeverae]
MKETGILLSAPMALATLAGAKTQTRRGNGLEYFSQPENDPDNWWCARVDRGVAYMVYKQTPHEHAVKCPYGAVGDRLYGREAWRTVAEFDRMNATEIMDACLKAGFVAPWAPIQYEADGRQRDWLTSGPRTYLSAPPVPGRYRHARFMPRWAARIWLEITGVRVERLQYINEADAAAEGVAEFARGALSPESLQADPTDQFRWLWGSINGPDSWDANPWVWVVEFRRVTPC